MPHRRPPVQARREWRPGAFRVDGGATDQELPGQPGHFGRQQPRHALLPDAARQGDGPGDGRDGAGLRGQRGRDALRPHAVLHGKGPRWRRHQHLGTCRERLVQGR